MFSRFSKEFILNIEDVTAIAVEGRKQINNLEALMTPAETIYVVKNKNLAKHIMVS